MTHAWTCSAVIVCLCSTPAFAQHDQHGAMSAKDIGTVEFQTSCAAAVRDDFNRAVALLHSFWFPESRALFEGVLKADPTCAMAHWGIALTYWGNPFGGLRAPAAIAAGKAAIDKAQATGSPTPREKGYIDAVAGLFSSADAATQRARVVAYEAAMAKVASDNPADTEARILWALAITQTALPTDKTYAQNLRAAEILEPLFKRMPAHPGLAHYIIHAYDVPALAPKALDAAQRYAEIAPVVPHALHMPSHTFTRVGMWKESAATNIKSADAAAKSNGAGDELHALDYQTYAYLQMARDDEARAVFERARKVAGGAEGVAAGAAGAGAFAIAAIPARIALERRAWTEAASLTPAVTGPPYTRAMTHFARAIGAARSGKPADAAPDIARLAALRDELAAMKDAYWAEQVDIQRRVAEAWVAFAEGRKDQAIAQLAAAADAEDATDKSAVTPGPLAPARELLGSMLLEAGRPKEALVAFEATIKKEPNRFLALYGAGQAAEQAGDRTQARQYYRQLVAICEGAPATRPELTHARRSS
jgi:tetratricopeptide (TPR) repeat protein